MLRCSAQNRFRVQVFLAETGFGPEFQIREARDAIERRITHSFAQGHDQ